ncbi:MAG TPA: hypothetical protein VJ725_33965 [Thermoanaerobaculia bacterium]|nr:hypothetical protein [Thermoanaerobaculia bacterium]
MSRTRRKGLGALWTQLASAPPNVASLKWDPETGKFEATFRETVDVNLHGEEDPAEEQGDPRFLLETLGNANFRKAD